MSETLLTAVQAAERLHSHSKTLAVWRKRGIGPKWRRIGFRIMYLAGDIDDYIAACEGAKLDTLPGPEKES